MPIGKPERVLLHHIPLKFVSKRVAGGGRKSVDTSIALVPFIDFLIVLVVFLLNSFASSDNLAAQSENLQMPDAANTDTLKDAPIVVIDANSVVLNGRVMANTRDLAEKTQVEPIEQMVEDLETMKNNWSIAHPAEPFPGSVILQAHKEVDFRVIKKVMFSAAQAGYANVSFAVNDRAASK